MTISDWLVIVAIIIAPICAIQVQTLLQRRKAKRAGQMGIFRTLMTTRATPLSPLHVQALNMIDIEFHKNKDIVEAWKSLLDNFEHYPTDYDDPNYGTRLEASSKKSRELLTELLHKMAKELHYSFDKVHLQRSVYIPKGHADIEYEQFIIRKNLIDLLLGKTVLPIRIADDPRKDQDRE